MDFNMISLFLKTETLSIRNELGKLCDKISYHNDK